MTGADGLSLRYDGGGVGDPLFSEFVLILLWPWLFRFMLAMMADNSLIWSCRGSVTTTTLELRVLSDAPLMPDLRMSKGILEADQSPLNMTKSMRVVNPWLCNSQYILVMMPRTLEIIAKTTKADMM